jgi:hypothetical protein
MRFYAEGKLVSRADCPSLTKPLSNLTTAPLLLGGGAFAGVIDEIRLSQVARYNIDFKPKTHFTTDAATLALYHCDEAQGDVLRDESGHGHDGKISGAKWVSFSSSTSAVNEKGADGLPSRSALDLSSPSEGGVAHVTLPQFANFDGPVTVEMYATPRTIDEPTKLRQLFSIGGATAHLRQVGESWIWAVTANDSTTPKQAVAPKAVQVGKRVHLAGVFAGAELRLFVGGRRAATTLFEGSPKSPPGKAAAAIGKSAKAGPGFAPFDGTIEEVRISKSARYDKDFTPPAVMTTDADTLALYHCDEGQGDRLTDSSGNGRHGKLVGAKWVPTGK